MHIVSLHFLVLVVIGLVLFHALPLRNWRRLVLLGLNVAFISSYANSLRELIPLACFLLLAFVCIRATHAWPSRKLFIGSILILLGMFVYLKQYAFVLFVPKLEMVYVMAGLSYILFRVLQVLVDVYQGTISERLSLFQMLNHSCFFLSFVAGPIQRFQDYRDQEDSLASVSLSSQTTYEAFSRIVNGCIKIAVISVFFQSIFEYCRGWITLSLRSDLLLIAFVASCIAYLLELYMNFSGYMDVVIGVGRLFGFSLPENFNWPLSSANFLEIWRRWHITLGEWFKFYLFTPIVKSLAHRWPNPSRIPEYGVLAFFVTFFVMGLWHKATYIFLIYGILIGFGVSINKLYELEMRRRLGKKRFSKLRGNFVYAVVAQGLTVAYFAITLSSFWIEGKELRYLAATFGLFGAASSLGLCTVLVGLAISLATGLKKCFEPLEKPFAYMTRAFAVQQAGLSIRVLVLSYLLFMAHSPVPEIAYMGF